MSDLAGMEICITGRLAALRRVDAVSRIEQAGGRFVAFPEPATALLVVGQDGPPLGDDGRMTHALRRARKLIDAGHPLRIVQERDLLRLLGLSELGDDLDRLYTIGQLTRILAVSSATVRRWVRCGLLRPARVVRRLAFFEFQEIATARALRRWQEQGVTTARIRESLDRLARWLPEATRSIAQLESLEKGGPMLVRLPDGQLAEAGGQLRLDFDAGRSVAPVRQHPGLSAALDWFEVAAQAEEEGRFADAEHAYRRELAIAGSKPEVHFNLGNVLYAMGRIDEAVAAFRAATALDAEYVEAWNNLGNALGEQRRTEEAVCAYRRALLLEPSFADAHYNLAQALAATGRRDEAKRHWAQYVSLDPHSAWAARAREQLREP